MTTDAPPKPAAADQAIPGVDVPAADDAPKAKPGRPRRPSGTTADQAPRNRGGRPKGSTVAATITGRLSEIVNTAGAAAAIMGDTYTAAVLTGPAGQRMCSAWGKAAAENPRLRKALDGLAAGGLYGELILATAAVVVPVAARYGVLGTGKWAQLAMASALPPDEQAAMAAAFMGAAAPGAAGGGGA